MELTIDAVPQPAHRYRLPALLQDIRLLDLLELSGTTLEASRFACLSQPTVSRRYRSLANDFALITNRRQLVGCCFGNSPTMRLLRLGCRAHRLAAGVARFGTDVILQPLLADGPWFLPAPPRFRPVESWLELVRQGVLDGALISGLEFQRDSLSLGSELELLSLGLLPLTLAMSDGRVNAPAAPVPTVLVPNRAVAQGLQRALLEMGMRINTVGNVCQSPVQWLQRLESSGCAMPLPQLNQAHWWEPLQWVALPAALNMPLWLVLPAGWSEQSVLAHTAEHLQRHVALLAQEGA